MPGFDGTGPHGEGPFSGRGEGYCAVKLPDQPGEPVSGYAGQQGRPVGSRTSPGYPARRLTYRRCWTPRWVPRGRGCRPWRRAPYRRPFARRI